MSLIRQIWCLLLASLLLASAGGAGVVVETARDTLQTQLRLKNSDNAQALALSLSQQKGDAELMNLLMAAQFDTGYYRQIRFVGADGKAGFTRDAELVTTGAPQWFVRLLPIESTPGVAQVSDGWRALGAVTVVSQTAFAHDELWLGSLRAAAALLAVVFVSAVIARVVVERIRRPLDRSVLQAQSIVDGKFVQVPEPRTPELQRVTRAMNSMVARLKAVFEAQAQQVEALRRQAHADPLTGLANRQHFMGQLAVSLHREDGAVSSGLILLRVIDLAGINRQLGHAATDRLIESVAQVLESYTKRVEGCHAGRLNGSDFALCLPVGGVAMETAQATAEALRVVLGAFGPGCGIAFGAVEVQQGRQVGEVMTAADLALARAESRGDFAIEAGSVSGTDEDALRDAQMQGEAAWREGIVEALSHRRMALVQYPLINEQSELIHLECPLRMQLAPQGPMETAARWLPLAMRARLTAAIDERAVELALAAIEDDDVPRCVNLSSASLRESTFAPRLRTLLAASPAAARRLWLEVPEAAAVEQFDQVQELGRQLRPFGTRLGLEHAGELLGRMERLFEGGLDYVKLGSAAAAGVAADEGRAGYVGGVVSMLHGLSIAVYAEGVVDPADARALWRIGVDGITGPWASALRGDLVS